MEYAPAATAAAPVAGGVCELRHSCYGQHTGLRDGACTAATGFGAHPPTHAMLSAWVLQARCSYWLAHHRGQLSLVGFGTPSFPRGVEAHMPPGFASSQLEAAAACMLGQLFQWSTDTPNHTWALLHSVVVCAAKF
jgi:hypothetical protein